MVTAVDATTALVVTVKLALLPPAGTVTLDGRAAMLGLPLDRETTAPPLGDGPLRVTVPVEDCVPPVTLVGFSVSDDRAAAGGVTVSDAVLLAPPEADSTLMAVDATYAWVITVELALLHPACSVTLDGRAAILGSSPTRRSSDLPLGDGPLRVTVPVEDCVPPVTLVGFSVSDDRVAVGGVTVSDAVLLAPP